MKVKGPSSPKPSRPFYRWRSVQILGGLLISWFILILVILPVGTRIYLQKWLVENGADTARIEKVRINPLMGVVALSGVDVVKDGKTVFSNSTVYIDLGLRYLIGREAHIQQATLANMVIDVEQYSDGSLRIGSYVMSPSGAESIDTPPEVSEQLEENIPWIFRASAISIENVKLHYRQPGLQAEIIIDQALLAKFNTDPDSKGGALTFSGSVNGAPVKLDLPTFNILPTLDLNGTVDIADVVLDGLEPLLEQYIKPFRGTAGLNGEIDFSMTYDMANLNVLYNGLVDLENGNIAGSGWATKGGVDWDGTVSFNMMNDGMVVDVDGDLRAINASFDMPDPVIDIDNADISVIGETTVTIGVEVVVDTGASLKLAATHYAMDFLGTDTGETTWDGTVRVETGTKDKPLTVHVDGDLSVAEPSYSMDMEGGSLEVANDDLSWKGVVDINLGTGEYPIVIDVDGDLMGAKTAFKLPAPVIDIINEELKVSGKTVITIGEEVIIDTDASLDIGPIDYTMASLGTSVNRTTWSGDVVVQTGTSTKDFVVRADGQLDTEKPVYSMDMNNSRMETASDILSWNGGVEFTMEPAGGSSQVRTDGSLLADTLTFLLPDTMKLALGNLETTGTADVLIGEELGVKYNGLIALDETRAEMAEVAAGEKLFKWSGSAEYVLGDQAQKLVLDGGLEAEGIFADLEEASLQVRQEKLEISPSFTLLLEDKASFTGELSLAGGGLQVNQNDVTLLNLEDITLSKAADNGSGGLLIESLSLNHLDVPASENVPVSVNVPSIHLAGIASPDLKSAGVARLEIEKPSVVNRDSQMHLAELDTISAEGIQVSQDIAIAIDRISSGTSSFLAEKDKDPLATLGAFSATSLTYSPDNGLEGDTIELDSLYGELFRKPAENSADAAEPDQPEPEETESTKAIPVKIGQIKVSGASGFKFTDTTLTRTFITEFNLESLQVNDLDLNQPEEPFSYSLQGNFDKYSPLSIKGSSAPLAEKLMVDQQTRLQNYSMVHATPYSIEAIGSYFPEGRLDFTSDLKLSGENIDMTNNLVFKGLEAETVNGELAEKLDNQLPVSLDLALSMLRDKDGTIELDIPVQGSLSSLDIGITDIFITALSKGITVAVTPYLAYTVLGPTGALAFAGAKLGQSMLATNLPYLEYEPGIIELTEKQTTQLDTVGKIIEQEAEPSYSICARVSPSELSELSDDVASNQQVEQNEAIRRELFKLGEARSLAVRDYLTAQFKIDESRLLICNPGLVPEKEGKPVVEFKK